MRWPCKGDKLVLEHKGGRIIRELDPQTPEAAQAKMVYDALVGAWKWLFVSRLRNGDLQSLIQVEFRLVPVEVELNPETKRVRKIIRERTDVKPEGNRLVLQEGDYVVPEVRNHSELRSAHITLLDLASNGAIAPIFPKPKTGDDTKFADSPVFCVRMKNRVAMSTAVAPNSCWCLEFVPKIEAG